MGPRYIADAMLRIPLLLVGLALGVAACSPAPAAEPDYPTTVGLMDITTPEPGQINAPSTTSATTPPATNESTATTTIVSQPRQRLVVSGTGDVNLDTTYIPELLAQGYRYPWTGASDVLDNDDLTIVNLECAASDIGDSGEEEFAFRCDTDALPFMRAGGVEVANLGNNHSGDYGKEALVDSRAQLQAADIFPVGVGADSFEAHEPAIVDINGWRVAILGFGGVVPAPEWIATPDRAGMADGDNTESMVAAVRAADEVADIVIVTVHWGVELDTTPRPDDRERAEAMVAAGADAIFGHHSHRLQPLEYIDGVPVAWGLGNFVWPVITAEGSTTAIAQVVFEPDGSVNACLIPTYIEEPGLPVIQEDYDPEAPCD